VARSKSGVRRSGATIGDVASLAGVSLSTVSRVMNGSTTVDAALAERVRDAAASLGYSASPLARSLVLGTTQTIAVVVPDLGNPTFQGALRGLSAGASERGYHVLVADSHEQASEERVLALDARRRCDGIVLCAPRMPEEELAAVLPLLAPAVVINRVPEPLQSGTGGARASVPTVVADYKAGLTGLLEHLHSLGHRHMLYLEGSSRASSNLSRLSAIDEFRASHPEVSISTSPCGVGFEDGHESVQLVVDSGATAVLAFNDLVAMGLLSSLGERGIRVPQDVSVTGFDDIPFARYTTPPLTTVTIPVEQLGEQAWLRLWALLSGEAPERDLSFGPHVVPRGSTGPAPER
jgi:LacI family transcriptional regulator